LRAALGIYALAAAGLFCRGDLLTGQAYFGSGTDPFLTIWMLRFFAPAIWHWQNPLILKLAWAPYGLNVAQTTTTPLLAMLAWPLSAWAGPVVAYNVVMMAAPALAAGAAFVLVREMTGRWGAAFAGGWVFGFSSAVFAPLTAHLQVAFVAFVPLSFWVILLRAADKISFRTYVAALAGVGICQFLTSLELFVALALFMAMFAGLQARRRDLLGGMLLAGVVIILAMAPVIYEFFSDYAVIPHMMQNNSEYVTDLLNFVVPARTSWLGGLMFAGVSERFTGNAGEEMGYAGLPLLAVTCIAAWRCRGVAMPVVICLAAAAIFTLGPVLHVAGRAVLIMPWAALAWAPVLDNVLPARLMIFVFLFMAVLCGLWLGRLARFYRTACLSVLGCAALMLPASRDGGCGGCWATAVPRAALFADGNYRASIAADANVLFLPLRASRSPAMYWQMLSGGYFRMANGYGDFIPPAVAAWPAVAALTTGAPAGVDFAARFASFVAGTDVGYVVVPAGLVAAWDGFLKDQGWARTDVADMAVYRRP
jgi:hypothetical protein